MKKWNELSIAERVPYIKMALDSGITDLNIVSERYNKFQDGGDINPYSVGSQVDAIYQNSNGGFMGLNADEWVDIGISMAPIIGTLAAGKTLYDEPSLENGLDFAVSLASEIPFLKWLKAGKLAKAAKASEKITENAKRYSELSRKIDRMENTPNINPRKIKRAKSQRGTIYRDNLLDIRERNKNLTEANKYDFSSFVLPWYVGEGVLNYGAELYKKDSRK